MLRRPTGRGADARPVQSSHQLGIVGVWCTTQFMAKLLYGLAPADAGTLSAAALMLLTVGGLAAYVPARRASKLDPITALRER